MTALTYPTLSPEALHDLRNQLQVLLATASALAEGLSEDDPHREDAEVMMTAARRAMRLAGPGGGGGEESVELSELLPAWEARFRRAVGPAVTLSLAVDLGVPPVVVDPDRMEDVLLNLLLNATQAMPFRPIGHVRVSVEQTQRALSPHAGLTPVVRVTVADDGRGMSEAEAAQCQEPAFTTRVGGGGLGLASVSRFVEASGGALVIDSVLGRGTTVSLYLPCAPDPSTRRDLPLDR